MARYACIYLGQLSLLKCKFATCELPSVAKCRIDLVLCILFLVVFLVALVGFKSS